MLEAPQPEAPQPEAPPEGGSNPVVGAMETLATFIAAQTEQGNPQSNAMKQWLQQGIELITAGGQEAPEEELPPEEAPEDLPPQSANRDINAGAGGVQVL